MNPSRIFYFFDNIFPYPPGVLPDFPEIQRPWEDLDDFEEEED